MKRQEVVKRRKQITKYLSLKNLLYGTNTPEQLLKVDEQRAIYTTRSFENNLKIISDRFL